jgi:microcystin-dependent protein
VSQPYVGEIRAVGFNFAPAGWALCDGSLLPISEYETLFNLIGTTYGGDGQSTFALPDLRGRTPLHMSGTFPIGAVGGVETVTLTSNQIPSHSHNILAKTGSGNASSPSNAYFAASSEDQYSTGSSTGSTLPLGPSGGSQPHENQSPFLCVNFIVSLFGVFPSQS